MEKKKRQRAHDSHMRGIILGELTLSSCQFAIIE